MDSTPEEIPQGATMLEICRYLLKNMEKSSIKNNGKGFFCIRLESSVHQALRDALFVDDGENKEDGA